MAQTKALWALLVSWSLGMTLFMPTVRAQTTDVRDQSAAELALSRAGYAEAQHLARAEIESGSLGPEDFAKALRVLAIASAHLADAAAASRAFMQLLAVKPAFRLERGESDDVRSPYLEARGFWSVHATPLAAKVVRPAHGGLELELVDPALMVARVRLRARVQGSATFSDAAQKPAAQIHFSVPGLTDDKVLEYSVALLDEHGNRILKVGSDSEPMQLAATAAPKLAASTAIEAVPDAAPASRPSSSATPSDRRRRLMILSLGSAVLAIGIGAAAVGVRAHLEREELAARWNEGTCSGTGTTRSELCAEERARIRTLETTTTALYSAGGAALVTGVVLLLLAPKRRANEADERARRALLRSRARGRASTFGCSGSAGWLGVSCAHAF